MRDKKICPLCGSDECEYQESQDRFYTGYKCESFEVESWAYISDFILDDTTGIRGKCLDIIYSKLLREPYCLIDNVRYKWNFYFDPSETIESYESKEASKVNLAFEIQNYPSTFTEKIDCALLNLAYLNPNYDTPLSIYSEQYRLLYLGDQELEDYNIIAFFEILIDFGYARKQDNVYYLTAKGWQHIDELNNSNNEKKQGFIAMSFRDETKPIRESFRQAIVESGHAVKVIDEKEHNNQIVPEIFYEIERSKFVAVDVTYPNHGAYYEAGYAQALGKQVIICCREEEFKSQNSRPHFDISQKSMVVWKDEEDLVARLKRRIEATVK